jgi:hypothetical protein
VSPRFRAHKRDPDRDQVRDHSRRLVRRHVELSVGSVLAGGEYRRKMGLGPLRSAGPGRVAGIATVLACCLPAAVALPVCALCATAALATMAAAGGAYLKYQSAGHNEHRATEVGRYLACTGSSCRYQCVPWGTPHRPTRRAP